MPNTLGIIFVSLIRCLFVALSRSKTGFSSAEGLRGRLPGTEAGRFGMGPAAVLGQDSLRFPGR
jgi:hypothetical protein